MPRPCVGALLLPPPSYCTSLTLVCDMDVDGFRAAVNLISALMDMAVRNRGRYPRSYAPMISLSPSTA
jgi:hypothetical protein